MFNKFLSYKIHWSIVFVILLSLSLFSLYQVNVKASGLKVFVGRISVILPMQICSNQYSCNACNMCGCGKWDQLTIAPIFGTNANSQFYACKETAFLPMGTGNLSWGSISFGVCQDNKLKFYNPATCNIWSTYNISAALGGTAALIGGALLLDELNDDDGGNTNNMSNSSQSSSKSSTENLNNNGENGMSSEPPR